ncbi:hypothetical protein FGF04_09365 [Streptomyces apricus]|uniref:Uncharacterized protein n=1 Tax=Streptomyces apricus TaxID=1828112 RepID=A0A5B0BED1_9ACTN|nr:hypothetical protein FGF04_09365 [Streptomyces apricus]
MIRDPESGHRPQHAPRAWRDVVDVLAGCLLAACLPVRGERRRGMDVVPRSRAAAGRREAGAAHSSSTAPAGRRTACRWEKRGACRQHAGQTRWHG